jgi:Uma2 family endonuclease
MNAPTNPPLRAAPRITVDELFHLMERGVIDPEARFELVEGEIVPMSPQGPLHQQMQRWLHKFLERGLGDRFWVAPGSTLILPEHTALDPDICIYPLEVSTSELRGDKVSLLIEIAVSSRSYDLGLKAKLYARMGAAELWVVDAERRQTHVHRGPQGEGWRETSVVPAGELLSPLAAPDVRLRLADAG